MVKLKTIGVRDADFTFAGDLIPHLQENMPMGMAVTRPRQVLELAVTEGLRSLSAKYGPDPDAPQAVPEAPAEGYEAPAEQ